MTTQYLEEADRLADRIIIINEGKIVAEGTAKDLKSNIGTSVLQIHVPDRQKMPALANLLYGFNPVSDAAGELVSVPITGGSKMLLEVITKIEAAGIELADIELRKPTLDEVFLSFTRKP